jgi:hypothetical protein
MKQFEIVPDTLGPKISRINPKTIEPKKEQLAATV